VTVIVVSLFESVFADHSKDHPVAVAHVGSDTLTRIRTPLCWTFSVTTGPPLREGEIWVSFRRSGVFVPTSHRCLGVAPLAHDGSQ